MGTSKNLLRDAMAAVRGILKYYPYTAVPARRAPCPKAAIAEKVHF